MSEHPDNHGHAEQPITELTSLGEAAWPVYNIAKILGFVGIIGGVGVGYFVDPGFRRFYFAYLVSFAFFLSIALGSLGFVLLQHLTRAGWSVNVRRVAECLAATMPILFALSVPILLSVLINNGALYRWAQPADPAHLEAPAHAENATDAAVPGGTAEFVGPKGVVTQSNVVQPVDELTLSKRPMLNRWTFILRIVVYFAIWSGLALWYWRRSTEQDKTGDVELTNRMQGFSAPAIIILVLSLTFGSFDLLMSLDPHWFSTMFGVYFLSGSMLAAFAAMILVIGLLQRLGYITQTVTIEHYHDLGKWLFAFVFFWGYIAFSQYMLLWYANIPEETEWLARRGGGSARLLANGGFPNGNPWVCVAVALLFGQLLIPFAGLLSKHVKRRRPLLMFWAAWLLVFHWIDLYWIAMPELDCTRIGFGFVEILCFVGVGGIYMATFMRMLAKNPLRPLNDPRHVESIAFQQAQ